MTKQKRHIRHSKRGKIFKAGRRSIQEELWKRKLKQLYQKGLLVGHAKEGDYYELNNGKDVWLYKGTKKEHWHDKKYWNKVK